MTPAGEDPIVEEIHQVREAIARAHGYDIKAIVSALRSEQSKHADLLVSREPKRLSPQSIVPSAACEEDAAPPSTGRRPT